MTASTSSKNPHAAELDRIDLAILAELAADARITNAALAQRVGVAESTSIKRLRALREAGIVTGFTTQLNLAALGFPIEAVIKVRLSNHNRDHVLRFHATLTRIPGVLTAFHVAGEDDFLVHVAVRTPHELRDLVLNHIVVHGGVQHTQTQLVFAVLAGPGAPIDTRKRTTRSPGQ
jgi:DNA-binding Lrp family transcriptional regulator